MLHQERSNIGSDLNKNVLASIETTMKFFTLEAGQVSVQPESTLWSILASCFARFVDIFALDDQHGILVGTGSLARMMQAVFDTNSRAFVAQDCPLALEDGQARGRLLAQAVAGLALIFRHLAAAADRGEALGHGTLSRELQLFAESEQRRDMLAAIEASHVFGACHDRSELVTLMMDAVEGVNAQDLVDRMLPLGGLGRDLLSYDVAWVSDRPCSNMGLPGGFTIMALN